MEGKYFHRTKTLLVHWALNKLKNTIFLCFEHRMPWIRIELLFYVDSKWKYCLLTHCTRGKSWIFVVTMQPFKYKATYFEMKWIQVTKEMWCSVKRFYICMCLFLSKKELYQLCDTFFYSILSWRLNCFDILDLIFVMKFLNLCKEIILILICPHLKAIRISSCLSLSPKFFAYHFTFLNPEIREHFFFRIKWH